MDATSEKLELIKTKTKKNSVLSAVVNYHREGWPNDKTQEVSIARSCWCFRHKLNEIKGILFHNERVVISFGLRKDIMLKRIHEGHFGIEKCKKHARDAGWWPGMGAAIEECVQRCESCQRHRASPPREPLAPRPLPWNTLAANIFEFNKVQYLVLNSCRLLLKICGSSLFTEYEE